MTKPIKNADHISGDRTNIQSVYLASNYGSCPSEPMMITEAPGSAVGSDRNDTEPWISVNYYEYSDKIEHFKGE